MLETMILQSINVYGNAQLEQVIFIIIIIILKFKLVSTSSNICMDCHYSCLTCSSPDNKTACLSCKQNYYLHNS